MVTYEEKFTRFKEKIKASSLSDFFILYKEMREIEDGLIKEKKEQWYNKQA
jgi:hypothetical protein